MCSQTPNRRSPPKTPTTFIVRCIFCRCCCGCGCCCGCCCCCFAIHYLFYFFFCVCLTHLNMPSSFQLEPLSPRHARRARRRGRPDVTPSDRCNAKPPLIHAGLRTTPRCNAVPKKSTRNWNQKHMHFSESPAPIKGKRADFLIERTIGGGHH